MKVKNVQMREKDVKASDICFVFLLGIAECISYTSQLTFLLFNSFLLFLSRKTWIHQQLTMSQWPFAISR